MIAAALLIAVSGPIYADPDRLSRIDKQFVCPEALHTDRAKVTALAKFDADMKAAVIDLTTEQLAEARMHLLRKHRCTLTLRRLREQGVR